MSYSFTLIIFIDFNTGISFKMVALPQLAMRIDKTTKMNKCCKRIGIIKLDDDNRDKGGPAAHGVMGCIQ